VCGAEVLVMNEGSAVATARMLKGQVARLVLAAGVAAVLAAGLGSGGARAAAVPSARSGTGPAVFSQVSCKGGSFCLATGSYNKPGRPPIALLEAWNGRTWRTFPKPRYYDSDNDYITCGGPKFCLAVTVPPPRHRPRTVAWNGRAWRAFTPQPPDPFDVTCPAARFCVTHSFPSFSGLEGDGWAVSWNGGPSWQTMPGALYQCGGPSCSLGVSCATASICFDQGSYCTDDNCDSTVDYAGTWNGTSWGPANGIGPDPDQACAGRSFCMTLTLAVTPSATISRDWGNSWHGTSAGLAAACRRAGCGQLHALACGSPWSCVALTSKSQTAPPAYALIWNGVRWKTARLAPAAGRLPALTLLACGSPRNCAAIGTYRAAPGRHSQPIAEHWNGSAWRLTPIPATS
jgi:hypothetical protein